jgi:outer membrane protein
MKKQNFVSLSVAFCLLVACYTVPAEAETVDKLKIGILDTQSLESAAQYSQMKEKLEKEFKPRQDKLQITNKEIEDKHQALEKDKDILSEKDRVSRERELNKLQQEFQLMAKEAQDDFRLRNQEESANLRAILDKAVADVAKKEGYDLILPNEMTVYNKDSKTFTNLVLKELENNFKAKK